jgi:thioredoxin-dependent peroxiredoxin
VGISADKAASQKKFRESNSLPFTLLADPDGSIIEAFGVKTTLGMASRQAFLIVEGKVAWKDEKASTKEQAADVLAALEALKG